MAKKINYEELNREEIIDEIMKKKEFSDLPKEDVDLVYSQFENRDDFIEEKIKLTRDLLRKMYTAFVSDKLLSVKDKDASWFLTKHISTKERMGHYDEIYKKVLSSIVKNKSSTIVFDFGCGINGFSYEEFSKVGFEVKYIGTEPVGQLCSLQNSWFKKRDLNAKIEHVSLFDLPANKKLILSQSSAEKKIGFFFKVLDSLEMLKRNYSKEVLKELVPLFDICVISWATRSLVSKKKFHAERKWLRNFILENFTIADEFDCGVEHYLIFKKK